MEKRGNRKEEATVLRVAERWKVDVCGVGIGYVEGRRDRDDDAIDEFVDESE